MNQAKPSLLFACMGNTCRSPMAEYICRHKFPDQFVCESAGFQPQRKADAENAVYALQSLLNIDASMHKPRDIRTLSLSKYDYVIAMHPDIAKLFAKEFPDFPADKLFTWEIEDPFGDDLSEYQECAQKIFRLLKQFSDKVRSESVRP